MSAGVYGVKTKSSCLLASSVLLETALRLHLQLQEFHALVLQSIVDTSADQLLFAGGRLYSYFSRQFYLVENSNTN